MSTLTTTRPALATQVRPASSVGFGRLSAIELRKLVDTRAARWLLAATAATAALGAGAMVLVATSPTCRRSARRPSSPPRPAPSGCCCP